MSEIINAHITYWSHGGSSRNDTALSIPQDEPQLLRFEPEKRFYSGRLTCESDGLAVIDIVSPRPFRLWFDGQLVIDEPLSRTSYQRELRISLVVPSFAGSVALLVEVGERSTWYPQLDEDCPSRNRDHVREGLKLRYPDRLQLSAKVVDSDFKSCLSLAYYPTQFHEDGVVWQLVMARPILGFESTIPSNDFSWTTGLADSPLLLETSISPYKGRDRSTLDDYKAGLRRYYVPVANNLDRPEPVRRTGDRETRLEPRIDIVRDIEMTVYHEQAHCKVSIPAYESLGRLAPRREYVQLDIPKYNEIKSTLPRPVLPENLQWILPLYDESWRLISRLFREPGAISGLPNPYIRTAMPVFDYNQFVWDSSFTAICAAYGWRSLPAYANLDLIYSRQFDGGYIHREHDVRNGMPISYEPDFSPNPPITVIAEWTLASLTGSIDRLREVYRPLAEHHYWLRANRRLDNGVYWTTGLANGLDNSPSLGDGYPDLTAQMAHHAELLGKIAAAIGDESASQAWEKERQEIGEAMNAHLWDESAGIFSTSLPNGGHNPNKVVTAFWPLWTGLVPPDRVESLANHLTDPASFWRHHPIPSLAADSPFYDTGGRYWLGSTWAPTNYAAIKGFDRAGRHDLALRTTLRHLECMSEVYRTTCHLWENYCAEKSERGSVSSFDYCWTTLGPITLLFEIVLGFSPDALTNTLNWAIPDEPVSGVENFAFGAATISVIAAKLEDGGFRVDIETDQPFTLNATVNSSTICVDAKIGKSSVLFNAK